MAKYEVTLKVQGSGDYPDDFVNKLQELLNSTWDYEVQDASNCHEVNTIGK
jgi:hypothetical protein